MARSINISKNNAGNSSTDSFIDKLFFTDILTPIIELTSVSHPEIFPKIHQKNLLESLHPPFKRSTQKFFQPFLQ